MATREQLPPHETIGSRPLALTIVLLCAAAAIALALGAAHVGTSGGSKESAVLLGACAAAALLAGLALASQVLPAAHPFARGLRIASSLAGPLVVVVLASMGTWIALGPGTRTCTGGISSMLGWTGLTPAWECRLAFGAGAAITWGMVIYGLGAHWVKRYGERGAPRMVRGLGLALLLLPLAPLLLLLVGGALLKAGAAKLFGHNERSPRDAESTTTET